VTDSHYTRTRVVEVLRVSPAKITAIHLGVSSDFCRRDHQEAVAQVSAATGIEWPYILFVGNLKPHKNLETLIRAFALLWARKKIDHQLLVLGDDTKRKGELLSECEKLGVAGVVRFIPQVSYDVLPWVYAAAELLVMPSLIEGFGLPVLEAMACGSPVVCSRAASLPEVAGEAAEFFDPLSVEDLAGAIGRVLESRELQETLRRKGLERAAHFSWDECARRHCEIYRQVLGT